MAASSTKRKLLAFGDVCGDLDSLFLKAETVNKAHGPFSCLLCVGSFSASESLAQASNPAPTPSSPRHKSPRAASPTKAPAKSSSKRSRSRSASPSKRSPVSTTPASRFQAQLAPYLSGEKKVPVPTYFIAGEREDPYCLSLLQSMPNGGEVCPGLHYLGRGGVQAVDGVSIAYLSGASISTTDGQPASPRAASAGLASLSDAASAEGFAGVDVLLTADWPRGSHNLISRSSFPKELPDPAAVGSAIYSDVAVRMAPRYHFAGTRDVHFTRLPYKNSGKAVHATRFIALGKVVSATKQKGVYACSIEPLAVAGPKQLEHPPNTTECPYTHKDKAEAHPKPSPPVRPNPPKKQKILVRPPTSLMPTAAPAYNAYFSSSSSPFSSSPAPSSSSASSSSSSSSSVSFGQPTDFLSKETPAVPVSTGITVVDKERFTRGLPSGDSVAGRWDMAPPPGYVCHKCNKPGHWIKDCPEFKNSHSNQPEHPRKPGQPPESYTCNICQEKGHWIQDCPHRVDQKDKPVPETYVCKICNEKGHWVQQCPHREHKRPPPEDYTCNICKVKGHWILECPVRAERRSQMPAVATRPAPSDCWFCLATPNVEAHMLVSIGDHVYMSLAKGGIVSRHVLLVPIEHVERGIDMAPPCAEEMQKFKRALTNYYAGLAQVAVFFERYLPSKVTTHAHIQAVPVSMAAADKMESVLQRHSKEFNMRFSEMPPNSTLKELVGADPYMQVEVGIKRYYCVVRDLKQFPRLINLVRGVIAESMGMPHRTVWKQCVVSKDQETKMAQDLKTEFKQFDFTE